MQRRTFLQSVGAGSMACFPLAPILHDVNDELKSLARELQQFEDDGQLWRRVQRCFDLDPDIIHLNCGSIGACPRLVTDALIQFTREIERNPYDHFWGDGLNQQLKSVKAAAAELLGADPDELALIRNTTEGMNIVATGLNLRPGDEVITSNHEHPGGLAAWLHLARCYGIRIRFIEWDLDQANQELLLKKIRSLLTPRTRALSFCHIDTITGSELPVTEIGQLAREKKLFFVCDGAQAPGMIDVDLQSLGVDAYVSSSHKWMLAPKGSGLLYVRKEKQDRVQAVQLSSGWSAYNASMGTRDIGHLLAHGMAIRFLQTIGKQKWLQRIGELNQLLVARLAGIRGLTRLTKNPTKTGIAAFKIDRSRGTSQMVHTRLARQGILVKPTQATFATVPDRKSADYNALRFSTHVFLSESQIEKAAQVLDDILNP